MLLLYIYFLFKGTVVLSLTAVADDIPEEAETFYVILYDPEGGAGLGDVTLKTVVIDRNDSPYGLLQIYPVGTRWVDNLSDQGESG